MTTGDDISAGGEQPLRSFLSAGADHGNVSEVVPGVFLSPGLGNSYLLTTPVGHLLVNTGTLSDAARARPLFQRAAPGPLRYIVATQSYVAQMGGLEVYMAPSVKLVAQRAFAANRADQLKLHGYYSRRNRKLYGAVMDKAGPVAGSEFDPDILVDDRIQIDLGGRQFEVISTPGGETTDAVVVWLPIERIAVTGNMFGPIFGNHPNLNTVRGDKPRSALRYIDSVRSLRALGAETILSAHQKITGAAEIYGTLSRMIDAVQWTHDRTIEGMNAGRPLHALMGDVRVPPELAVGEAHGKVAWNVRAIWHEYSGWFDYDEGTTALYHVPRGSLSGDLVGLIGGLEPIVARAKAHVDADRPVHALHLLDIALAADGSCAEAIAVRRAALARLAERSGGSNFSEAAWLRAELTSLAAG